MKVRNQRDKEKEDFPLVGSPSLLNMDSHKTKAGLGPSDVISLEKESVKGFGPRPKPICNLPSDPLKKKSKMVAPSLVPLVENMTCKKGLKNKLFRNSLFQVGSASKSIANPRDSKGHRKKKFHSPLMLKSNPVHKKDLQASTLFINNVE
ncbi:hypothetical protein TanjilG_07258 [Lupinus angustifolius]|uniref:Uncharacterized protein n=1 Tax=Lupinus angustifolius TaxID=3871 RepID=A0A1J7H9H1_LUPAN|nr:hypothetical protein TanjilG_07258 [Lupinus angustifolius]